MTNGSNSFSPMSFAKIMDFQNTYSFLCLIRIRIDFEELNLILSESMLPLLHKVPNIPYD